MNVLLINITGHAGSTGKIVTDIRDELTAYGHSVYVAYGHTEYIKEPGYFRYANAFEARMASQFSKLGRAQYKGNPLGFCRLKRIIKKVQPDVVHIHCLNGHGVNLYDLFSYLGSIKISTIITHHAEFYYTGSCAYSFACDNYIYNQCKKCPCPKYATFNRLFSNAHKDWKRMERAISNFNPSALIFTAVSPWVQERSKCSPIVSKYRCDVVLNGVNTSIFHYISYAKKKLVSFPSNKRRTVLHVTHNFNPYNENDIKGGRVVVELAKCMREVNFVVVASDYVQLQETPDNLMLWGRAKSQNELATLYSASDITLLCSKRETFSMVTAESLCCGTPVVGFRAGGPESIALPNYSRFVPYDNTEELIKSIIYFFENMPEKESVSKEGIAQYSREKMCKSYLKLYQELVLG